MNTKHFIPLSLLAVTLSVVSSVQGESLQSSDTSNRSLHQNGIPDDRDDPRFSSQQSPPKDFLMSLPTTASKLQTTAVEEDFQSISHLIGINQDGTHDNIFRLKSDGLTASQKDALETLIQEHGTKDTKFLYEYKHAIVGFAMKSMPPVLRGKIDELLRNDIDRVGWVRVLSSM